MKEKVSRLLQKLEKVEAQLGDPDVLGDKKRYRELTQEHSYLTSVKACAEELEKYTKEAVENREMLEIEEDPEFREVLTEELTKLDALIEKKSSELETLLVPPDPNDHKNTIIEIRAGTGGDEAALFVGDVTRMYRMFADRMGWSVEVLSSTPSEAGGFKELIMVLSGPNVFRMMQYEAGTHRVQRVPETEAQGRVHTSAITVAALAEPGEDEVIKIEEKDLRVDTYRSSGAGGQHVNTTDSAVRLTHLPTGIVVACQDERSQIKNREKALRLLAAKVAEEERLRKEKEMASARQSQVGTGDRSERIRTYNFPQNRVTDHRIDLTLYNLDRAMDGELDEVSNSLVKHYHQKKLNSDADD